MSSRQSLPPAVTRRISPASEFSTALLVAALREVRSVTAGRLVDVGCGSKPYLGFFPASRHFGVDWPRSLHPGLPDCYASADALPIASGSVDTVLCTELIEHVLDPLAVVREGARVLRDGGHLVLSAPFVHEPHERPFDYYRFSPDGLLMLARRAGLEPLRVVRRGGPLAVTIDLVLRSLLRILRGACRRLQLPPALESLLTAVVVVAPQRLVVALWARPRVLEVGSEVAGNTSGLSLGYVLVARRCSAVPSNGRGILST